MLQALLYQLVGIFCTRVQDVFCLCATEDNQYGFVL